MKTTKKPKKLTLTTLTVRALDWNSLRQVTGGGGTSLGAPCPKPSGYLSCHQN